MARRRKTQVVNNSKGEPQSLRVKAKSSYSQNYGIDKKRTKQKHYDYFEMKKYIRENHKKALNKLKRSMSKGYYSASEVLQNANSQMHMIYKKLFDEEYTYSGSYDGRIFGKLLRETSDDFFPISNNDVATLFRAIDNILSVDARKASREFKRISEQFKQQNMDYLTQFRRLSRMSTDFHEIFAFLSYDDISHYMEQGYTDDDIYKKYLEMTQDKWLDLSDEQKMYSERLEEKFRTKLDSYTLDNLFNGG